MRLINFLLAVMMILLLPVLVLGMGIWIIMNVFTSEETWDELADSVSNYLSTAWRWLIFRESLAMIHARKLQKSLEDNIKALNDALDTFEANERIHK